LFIFLADNLDDSCKEGNTIRKARGSKRTIIYVSPNNNNKDNTKHDDDSPTTNEPVLSHKETIETCTKAVTESTFGKACIKSYPTIDYKLILDNCVSDIQVINI